MDESSYKACIRSLWSVAEHLHMIDLEELEACAVLRGTEEERRMVRRIRIALQRIPARPGHRPK
jgi:hypothetical protein